MSFILKPDLAYAERALSEALDPEREAWRASRRRFVEHNGMVVPVKAIQGASFLTGTSTELVYSNTNAGTAKNTFTTEATINDTAGMGPFAILPPYFFMPSGSAARTLRIVARGIYSTTVAPTWQVFARLNAGVPASPPTGPNVGSIAATALGSTVTNLIWEFEEEVQLTVAGANGANSTLRGLGIFSAALTASTSVALGIFGAGASPGTVATFDISATSYLTISAACGTSSASNQIQLLQLLLFGLN